MSLLTTLQSDMKQAMKVGEAVVRDALRLILANLKNTAIDSGKDIAELTDGEVIVVLRREIKRRKESISAFQEGGRDDLIQQEKSELEIFEKYVPEQMSADAIDAIVQEVVDGLGDKDKAEFGQVMGMVMKKIQGKADGSLVSERVKAMLS